MANTPRFDAFKQHYQAGRWAQALVEIDALAASQPGHAPTHWHRANTLEQLERHAEAADAIDRVLALAPDYVPALRGPSGRDPAEAVRGEGRGAPGDVRGE